MKITAVTGGRADWGLLSPVLKAIQKDRAFKLNLIVTGQHLMRPATSLNAIKNDGFKHFTKVDMRLSSDDSASTITKSMGLAVAGFAEVFKKSRPHLLLVLGDRYEIMAAVQAALIAKIPVAHFCGGDVTEGAIDDSIRHAMTKMSHLHFVTNKDAAKRVAQLGEDPKHIYNVGSPGLDHIHSMKKMSRAEFFKSINFKPYKKNVLVTFHPVTLEKDSAAQCHAILNALAKLKDVGIIITASNADPEGQTLTTTLKTFAVKQPNAVFHESLGTLRYLNSLRHVDAVIGNSSSGLYEAPSFGIPTVNIGDRQKGRLKAASVIDCKPVESAIFSAIQKALKTKRKAVKNPYGDGRTAPRIVKILKTIKNSETFLRKKFHDR